MKKLFLALFLTTLTSVFSQVDSLKLGDSYYEDQLYLSVTYNQLYSQPTVVSKSGISFNFSAGYMRDIPLNKQQNFGIAIGAGYSFDSYNHQLKVDNLNNVLSYSVDGTLNSNTFKIHNIDIPFEVRWRTSTAQKFKFWRVYPGFKLSYNLSNTFSYTDVNGVVNTISNLGDYNKLQYGLTLSVGYDAFNAYTYLGLSPLFNNAAIGAEKINTKQFKVGLIFYLL
ncbi:MAG: porin family protein [Flavobacteriaceae bacterium]